MLNNLLIKNFQSHENTVLKFHEGVNVIVGETDSGKSAIVRALRLLINNRPSGDEFVSTGKKDCLIKAKVDDSIVRRKKGQENIYQIGKKKYKAFGQSVPEEVSELLNISDVNMQNQLDSPFLLSESSAEVARYFNKIVKLDVIDRSLKNISQRIRSDRHKLSDEKLKKSELSKSIKEYDWVVDASDKIRKLEITEKSITKTSKQIRDIENLIEEIDQIELEKKELSKLLKAKPEIEQLIKLHKEIEKDKEHCELLAGLVEEFDHYHFIQAKKIEELKKLRKQFSELMPDVCPLCEQEVR